MPLIIPPAAPKEARKSDISTLWAILLTYYLLRFFIGGFALPILGLFALTLLPSLKAANLKKSSIFYNLFSILFYVASIGYSIANSDSIAANYFIFSITAIWIKTTGSTFLVSRSHEKLKTVTFIYIVATIPFLLIPSLQNFSMHVIPISEKIGGLYVTEDTHGLLAFFYHAGEFGTISASLAAALWSSVNASANRIKIFSMDVFLFVALFAFVLISRSTTALAIIMAAFLFNTRLRPLVGLGFVGLFAMQVVTQLFLPGTIANIIKTGSFWWRYVMAREITGSASSLLFNPLLIHTLENWPHSVLMDFCLCFGKIAALLFALFQIAYSFSAKGKPGRGWNALFYCCASVGPIGAGPFAIATAIACGYSESLLNATRLEEKKTAAGNKKDLIFAPLGKRDNEFA